jgi:NAD(P)-dependent dehydrogenase (short-subunit alcohol dehydrogenase family)
MAQITLVNFSVNHREPIMKIEGKVVVVTGGASGIGRALCECFSKAGASKVIVADRDIEGADRVARTIRGASIQCDVSIEADLIRIIDETERNYGPIDIFCSNAGIAAGFEPTLPSIAASTDDVWLKSWSINVMAHVYAARALVPRMKERGRGYFLNTISAAGLLTQIGSAVYATTKHAAVGFAEVLAISHHKQGVRVSILCPQGVDTPMLRALPQGPQSMDGVISATDVAIAALAGIEREQFLILPHAKVSEYMSNKASDYDTWINRMVKLQERLAVARGS